MRIVGVRLSPATQPGVVAAQGKAQRSTARRSLHGTGRLEHPLLCAPVGLGHVCLAAQAQLRQGGAARDSDLGLQCIVEVTL